MRSTRRRMGRALVAAIAGVVVLAACDPPPPPVTLKVSSSGDASDTAPGDGVCQTAGLYGPCTLRAALQEAAATEIDRIELTNLDPITVGSDLVIDPAAEVLAIVGVPLGATKAGWITLAGGASLTVASGRAELSQLAIEGGDDALVAESGGSAVLIGSTVTGASAAGVRARAGGTVVAGRSSLLSNGTGLRVDAGGTAVVAQSTASGNGTGIDNDGTANVVASTIGGSASTALAGAVPVDLEASVVVGADPVCATPAATSGWNGLGSGCGLGPDDVAASPADLGPLSGDPVPSHRLSSAAVALDGHIPLGTSACTASAVDQRGAIRAGDGSCEPGAVEGVGEGDVIVVDSAADAPDTAPGDDICQTTAGVCTLRAAFQEASAAYDPELEPVPTIATRIAIAPGIDPALDPARGRVRVTGLVTVDGGGATIDGGGASGVIWPCKGTLTLLDLTVTGGGTGRTAIDTDDCTTTVVLDGVTLEGNAGTAVGSGYTGMTLEVTDSIIRDNGGSGIWGDLYAVEVEDSTISGNGGSGVSLVGGGGGPVTIRRSTVSDNGSTGISLEGHLLLVEDTLVEGSTWSGIDVDVLPAGSTVRRSALIGNRVGVYLGAEGGAGLILEDTLVSGSTETGVHAAENALVVRRSTIAENGAAEIVGTQYGSVSLSGSIVSGPGVVCGDDPWNPGSRVPLTSGGANVVSDTTCGLTGPGDVEGVDPLLGPLADDGGPTWSRLPGVGSPARDAIAPGTAGLCTVGLTDQRGVARPQGPACDVGAVEQ